MNSGWIPKRSPGSGVGMVRGTVTRLLESENPKHFATKNCDAPTLLEIDWQTMHAVPK